MADEIKRGNNSWNLQTHKPDTPGEILTDHLRYIRKMVNAIQRKNFHMTACLSFYSHFNAVRFRAGGTDSVKESTPVIRTQTGDIEGTSPSRLQPDGCQYALIIASSGPTGTGTKWPADQDPDTYKQQLAHALSLHKIRHFAPCDKRGGEKHGPP